MNLPRELIDELSNRLNLFDILNLYQAVHIDIPTNISNKIRDKLVKLCYLCKKDSDLKECVKCDKLRCKECTMYDFYCYRCVKDV